MDADADEPYAAGDRAGVELNAGEEKEGAAGAAGAGGAGGDAIAEIAYDRS